MTNQIDIKKEVLRRVRFVYFVRRYTQPLYLEFFAVVVLLGAISYSVSVKDVVANLSDASIGHAFAFLTSAFKNTELIVQIIFCVTLVVLALLVKDLLRQHSFKVANA